MAENEISEQLAKVDLSTKAVFDEEKRNSMDRLNDDCLMHVFQYLNFVDRIRLERVNKRWQAVLLNSWQNYRDLKFVDEKYLAFQLLGLKIYNTNLLLQLLMRCGEFLRSIVCDDEHIPIVSKLCPNLEKLCCWGLKSSNCIFLSDKLTNLQLFHSNVNDDDLKPLFEKNHQLRTLFLTRSKINGSCLLLLPESVEELFLDECEYLETDYVCPALKKLKHLKRLKIYDFKDDVDAALRGISNCEQLESLLFQSRFGCCEDNAERNIAQWKNLRQLNLRDYDAFVGHYALLEIATHCVNLTYLNVSYCNISSYEGISALFSLPNLEHLEMAQLENERFDIPLTSIPLKLKTLNCRNSGYLEDQSICSVLEAAPNLEYLRIDDCDKLTKHVVEVAINCTKQRTNNIFLKLRARHIFVDDDFKIDEKMKECKLLGLIIGNYRNYEPSKKQSYLFRFT